MHKNVRARRITGRGKSIEDKTAVMGLLERGGQVRTQVIPDRTRETLQSIVRGNVAIWHRSIHRRIAWILGAGGSVPAPDY